MNDLIKATLKHLKDEYPKDGVIFTSRDAPAPVVKQEAPQADWAEKLKKVAPTFKLRETVLNDADAKNIGTLWKEHIQDIQVAIIAFSERDQELQFLQNVAKAISTHLAPAQVISGTRFEKEKKWDLLISMNLKLILAPDLSAWKGTDLATHYRLNTTTQKESLETTPLIIFNPISSYLQNPASKKELWTTICSLVSS